jgi:hypothetical protein
MQPDKKFFSVILAIFLAGVVATLLPQFAGAKKPAPRSSCNNAQKFVRPIPLGVSGGNIDDSSTMYCCGGTLGCLVVDANGEKYILSNNHVLAQTNQGAKDEFIVQPGLIDSGCQEIELNAVAELTTFIPINFSIGENTVDAAIAMVEPGEVRGDGSINCIGLISSEPLPQAELSVGKRTGTLVQKSGRTSGLTSGRVGAQYATLWVYYTVTCGVGSQRALFVDQIRVDGANFSKGGDSGSLIVTKPQTGCPQPVGLLFAGGGNQTFANPIEDVLGAFNVAIVGDCSTASSTGEVTENMDKKAHAGNAVRLKEIKEKHKAAIMAMKGVAGIGIGADPESDEPVI